MNLDGEQPLLQGRMAPRPIRSLTTSAAVTSNVSRPSPIEVPPKVHKSNSSSQAIRRRSSGNLGTDRRQRIRASSPTIVEGVTTTSDTSKEVTSRLQQQVANFGSMSLSSSTVAEEDIQVLPTSRDRTSQVLQSMDNENVIEEHDWTDAHLKLLHMIWLYTAASSNTWVKRIHIVTMIYEGILQGCFDYDFAPSGESDGLRRIFLNVSQDGVDDVDDLLEGNLLVCLNMTSSDCTSNLSYRLTHKGQIMADQIATSRPDLVLPVERLIHYQGELLYVTWDNDSILLTTMSGSLAIKSSVTEVRHLSLSLFLSFSLSLFLSYILL